MGHPRMYEDSDPLLADLREVCLAMPGAGEKVAHGRPVWFTKNVFAIFGGSVKGDRGSMQLARALLFRPEPQEEQALMQDPRCHVPAYWGPHGWLALPLDTGDVDWEEVSELVDGSFRETAPATLVRRLDE